MSRKPEANRRAAEQMDADGIRKMTASERKPYCGASVSGFPIAGGQVGCPRRASYHTPHGPRCAKHARPD